MAQLRLFAMIDRLGNMVWTWQQLEKKGGSRH